MTTKGQKWKISWGESKLGAGRVRRTAGRDGGGGHASGYKI